ncbi:MAG TPA: hypothetical protein VLV18_05270 [Terriglobales bacterium]|nr:hypothetical protein [Terriglobales bacterium]
MRKHSEPTIIHTGRDLLLLPIGGSRLFAMSCDAAGGIGAKLRDRVKTSPRVVGRFTARVAMMEVLAIGADPVSVAATLSVEPKPSGNQILKGIKDEIREARTGKLPILCSSEKNVTVSQTGIGVTVLGVLRRSQVMIGKCKPGDELVAIGEPRVRKEVLEGARRGIIADTGDVCKLRNLDFVHELIPVGSKGILHEATTLANDSELVLRLANSNIDLRKSAGPSCVLLCAIANGTFDQLKRVMKRKPLNKIGFLTTG